MGRGYLGERIQAETPELAEGETRATRMVTDAWSTNSGTGARNDLRARIGTLVRDHGVPATFFAGAERWGQMVDDNQARLVEGG